LMTPQVARIGRALVAFEPAQAAAGIAPPVLVVQGKKDVQVDPLDAEKLVAARRSAGKPVDHYVSPDADHVLKKEPRSVEEARSNMQQLMVGYNAADRTLATDLVDALAGWIERTR